MPHQSLETLVEINAPASKVWAVFTEPTLTRQLGGEYVSDWTVGSHLRWKTPDGQMLTDGIILRIEPEIFLQHSLLNPDASSEDDILAVLTYEFQETEGHTTLQVREDFTTPLSDTAYADSMEGWNGVLSAMKEIAEK